MSRKPGAAKPSRTKSRTTGRKPARKGPAKRFSTDQVAAALRATGGLPSHAARWLAATYKKPCSRPAVVKYIKDSPQLQRLLEAINEVRLDDSEARLFGFIDNGSERSLHFYLATKGKDRGYTRREAVRMIVAGFFQQVFDRITIESVRDALGEAIGRRVRDLREVTAA